MPVAITSIGAVTGHGLGCEPLLSAILEGRSAIRPLTRFSAEGLCSSLAAEAPPDEALVSAAADLRQPPAVDRASRLLLAAAAEALRGRVSRPGVRRGVVVGTTKGALELAVRSWETGGVPTDDILGAPARSLALASAANGPVLTVGAACASSAVALGEALALIDEGTCDEVIVGGTEALHPFVYRGFHALKALSAAPAAPFDAARSGLSLGEGAAVLVVESLEHARRAGRSPIVLLEGFGSSSDGFDQTAPDPTGAGLALACRRALERAGLQAGAVGRYHAHGTATLHNDRMEAAMHAALFEGRAVPVCGIKGSTGHTLGAAGALDAAVCALTLHRGVLPPIANLKQVDPSAALPAVVGTARADEGTLALVANAGFGGINAALVLRRPGVER
ncbi:beta-ketoacyl synthase N-terminal-like domain-containing protein [Vitiosangium sp. GDMCC 1.1324]|uniref:beta-ketoacyl synthase N-terminal-like domain-containing protein n=1 Tax=Vitiosangium sp. (strain GDMCC 1.1324) TaxID=2138576 RepID=UPI00130EB546|nr:beta-ketoacyl synthase N-terminal-like domain-containing protein [Vitiosangium sp. GDMCC 1.1324]